jgi:hypothetical protein
MEELTIRPKLFSFRVEAFSSENRTEGNGSLWKLELKQEIQVGLAAPINADTPFQAVVKIELLADASNENDLQQTASFKGEYVAKFNFPIEAAEAVINDLIDREPYQYVLVAQAFPLAMTHFRRELQATGFNDQQLPLGI